MDHLRVDVGVELRDEEIQLERREPDQKEADEQGHQETHGRVHLLAALEVESLHLGAEHVTPVQELVHRGRLLWPIASQFHLLL